MTKSGPAALATETHAQGKRPARGGVSAAILEAAIAFVRDNGAAALAVRPFAESLGTSHRMVLHYFGSRDGLLAEVFRELRSEDMQQLTTPDKPVRDLLWDAWRYYAAPDNEFRVRMLLGLIGSALNDGHGLGDFLDELRLWTEAVIASAERDRRAYPAARGRAAVAGLRGLLIELQAHGDRAACDDAARRLIDDLFPDDATLRKGRMPTRKSTERVASRSR